MNGVLLVNKEEGRTSRDIVNDCMHIFNTKKIGHTGTLDPLATGVLVITIGRYTKLGDALTSTYKEYIAEFKLGIETDTLDITGNILNKKEINVENNKVIDIINSFKGTYEQEVPKYSAVKINGKKLYEYARSNEDIELPKREVDIKEIEVLNIDNDLVTIKCLVSKGTYIRSLIRDIGTKLDTYATMTKLTRTKQGIFDIKDTYTIEQIRDNNYKLLSIEEVLDVEIVNLNDNEILKIDNGIPLEKEYTKDYILFKYRGKEHALYKYEDNKYKMYIKIEI